MDTIDPISPADIEDLEQQLSKLQHLVEKRMKVMNKKIQQLKKKANYELIGVKKAAQIMDRTERHIHHLASDPDVPIYKYHKDGTLKQDNRKTSVRFNKAELLAYKNK